MEELVRREDVLDILRWAAGSVEKATGAVESLPAFAWPEGRKGDFVIWKDKPGHTKPYKIQAVLLEDGVRYDFGTFSVSPAHGCIERIVPAEAPEAAEFKRQNVGGVQSD